MDFGQMVQETNDSFFGMLSQEEQLIAAREDDNGRWQEEDIVQREGGVIQILKRLEQDGHINREEATLLAWAANVKI